MGIRLWGGRQRAVAFFFTLPGHAVNRWRKKRTSDASSLILRSFGGSGSSSGCGNVVIGRDIDEEHAAAATIMTAALMMNAATAARGCGRETSRPSSSGARLHSRLMPSFVWGCPCWTRRIKIRTTSRMVSG
jgi:hypothetical protein